MSGIAVGPHTHASDGSRTAPARSAMLLLAGVLVAGAAWAATSVGGNDAGCTQPAHRVPALNQLPASCGAPHSDTATTLTLQVFDPFGIGR